MGEPRKDASEDTGLVGERRNNARHLTKSDVT